MKQCENCFEWVEDLQPYKVYYPATRHSTTTWVCPDCMGHLATVRKADPDIEVGSPAAQRDYQKPDPISHE